jgi:hypothetical protein
VAGDGKPDASDALGITGGVRKLPAAALIALACPALGACGTGGAESDAAQVVERFHAALGAGDGAQACEQLSDATRRELARQEGKPCERAVLSIELARHGTAAETRVHMTSASVDLAAGGTAFLDETSAGWRISAAGCAPTRPGRPYDCELED